MLFGFDDAASNSKFYSQSTRCKTDNGTIFWINKADFLQKIASYSETQKFLTQRIAGRDEDVDVQDALNYNVF